MSESCPLCQSARLETVETVRVADLLWMYRRWVRQDVAEEFGDLREIAYLRCGKCDLRFFSPSVPGSEQFYQKLIETSDRYYLEDKSEYEFAKKFIRGTDKVLEIGSGRGAFAKKLPTRDYTGLELSPKAVELASREGIVVRNELLDVHAPGREEAYDVVCAFQTLEHVPDPSSFVRLCVQSLKKGGFLIYSVPSADSYVSMIPNAVPNLPPHHLSHWPDATLMKIAELFGLKVVAMEHEFLSDVHRVGYATTICFLALNDLLRRKPALVDVSFKGRMVIKIASVMGRFLGRGLRDPRVLPRGHSVTVVYGKGSAE